MLICYEYMAYNLRSGKMSSIKDDVKLYFQDLVKDLATNDSVKIMNESVVNLLNKLETFEKNMVERFEKRFTEQEDRITKLEATLALRQNTVDKLLEKMESRCDNNEQYTRRSCLRIHGIEVGGNNEAVDDIVESCFQNVNMEFGKECIDRAHRIGQEYEDVQTKKSVKSIIVKFKSWHERSAFYKARPKIFIGGIKKEGVLPFRVSLDLTKRRCDLLKHATDLIENNHNFLYAFADINCALVIKDSKNKYHYFNSKNDLQIILDKFEA